MGFVPREGDGLCSLGWLSAGSGAKFHGNSSSMRLMGCSAMGDSTFLMSLGPVVHVVG